MNNFTNKVIAIVAFTCAINISHAQVRIVNSINNTAAPNSSAFIDASSNSATNAQTNVGKGLIFPRTDLKAFTTFSGTPIGVGTSYPTRFDGMVVYNTAVGGSAGVGATSEPLFPGFWYYENKSTTLTGGTWKPVTSASSPKENILLSETITNRQVNNAQVYGIKGKFTATGNSTAVDIPSPTGLTAMYSITIYKSGTSSVFSRDLYSYTPGTTLGNAITGSPSISVVYPAGDYDYVLEYLK